MFRITKRKMLFKQIFSLMGRFFFWLFIWSRRIVASVLHMSVYFSLSLLHVLRYFLFLLGGFYCLIHYNQIHGWYTVNDYSIVIVAICIITSLVAEGLVSVLVRQCVTFSPTSICTKKWIRRDRRRKIKNHMVPRALVYIFDELIQ